MPHAALRHMELDFCAREGNRQQCFLLCQLQYEREGQKKRSEVALAHADLRHCLSENGLRLGRYVGNRRHGQRSRFLLSDSECW